MVLAAAAKAFFGAVLVTMMVFAWQQFDDLNEQQELSAAWENTQDYAVFYPHSVGNDRAEIEAGGHSIAITEARDLYPILDEAGGIFMESVNYEPWVPTGPQAPMPTYPVRVNLNYLQQYPIMDESGSPIMIDPDEQDWVVAVPEQYKPLEDELAAHLQATRTGGADFEGAVQGQERFLGEPVPEQFRDQKVQIIWTASDQEVFSFNTTINPDNGHTILDPIVEIMTPANSMTVDRLNSFNGDLNSPMKVRVDGDSAAVLAELAPTLRELNLDDNLRHLVTTHEAILGEVDEIRSGIAWLGAFIGAALLIVLLLEASLVSIVSDRLHRRLTVRRLHGTGFVRTYRELLILLAATFVGQALLAAVMVGILSSGSSEMPDVEPAPAFPFPLFASVLGALLVVEVLLVAVTAGILERRNAVKRLKEL